MKIPVVRGLIERRILVNYTVELEIIRKLLPKPFRAKVINGKAIAGICLIRLSEVRPKGLPSFIGFGSENGAHRIAVEWDENGENKEGVYVPRRDTSSIFNALVGGRLFPGKHYHAKFNVVEDGGRYLIGFKSSDGTIIKVDATIAENLPKDSVFKDLKTASDFFKSGSAGYSPKKEKYEGLLLNTFKWDVKPLDVSNVKSSFFENKEIFPVGSIRFDNALLMTNIEHEWWSLPNKVCL